MLQWFINLLYTKEITRFTKETSLPSHAIAKMSRLSPIVENAWIPQEIRSRVPEPKSQRSDF